MAHHKYVRMRQFPGNKICQDIFAFNEKVALNFSPWTRPVDDRAIGYEYVAKPADWAYSTFHKFLKMGFTPDIEPVKNRMISRQILIVVNKTMVRLGARYHFIERVHNA